MISMDEFERDYAERSELTVADLRYKGLHPEPCYCGVLDCKGWKMSSKPKPKFLVDDLMSDDLQRCPMCHRVLNQAWQNEFCGYCGWNKGEYIQRKAEEIRESYLDARWYGDASESEKAIFAKARLQCGSGFIYIPNVPLMTDELFLARIDEAIRDWNGRGMDTDTIRVAPNVNKRLTRILRKMSRAAGHDIPSNAHIGGYEGYTVKVEERLSEDQIQFLYQPDKDEMFFNVGTYNL